MYNRRITNRITFYRKNGLTIVEISNGEGNIDGHMCSSPDMIHAVALLNAGV